MDAEVRGFHVGIPSISFPLCERETVRPSEDQTGDYLKELKQCLVHSRCLVSACDMPKKPVLRISEP